MEDIFNLDFDEPEEIKNERVLEKNLYHKLVEDGFIFNNMPNGSGAAYIMQDGNFLFLEQNKKFFSTDRITHGSLDFYLIKQGYVKQTEASRILCQTDNAIRINDGSNFIFEVLIGLPQFKPTIEQFESLENWLYKNIENKKYFVSVGNELVSEVFQQYNLKEQLPEEVIKKIKNYYNNGILREAKEIKFQFSIKKLK